VPRVFGRIQFNPDYVPQSDSDFWELIVFDPTGRERVSLELHPDEAPDLVLFADDIGGKYCADFGSGQLTKCSTGVLSGMGPMQMHPTRPVRLSDNRGKKLWSAP
jgi:hypothetical protein